MSSDKIFIIFVVLFLIAEIIETVVNTNPNVRKQVQSNAFLNFVYQDAIGYVHIFEKTEMPNRDKLNGVIDAVFQDAQRYGYKITDEDKALIEGAVEYAVNKMHLANSEKTEPQIDVDVTATGNTKSVDGLKDEDIKQTVPDAPQLTPAGDVKNDK